MKTARVIISAAAAALVAAAPMALSAQQISNAGSLSGQSVSPFGYQNSATYGESFVAPAGFMNDFSFWLADNLRGDQLTFKAYVSRWNGSELIGPLLFASLNPISGTNSASFVKYTFNTGSLALTTGFTYMAFINASEFIAANQPPGQDKNLKMAIENTGTSLVPGSFAYAQNGPNFADLYNPGAWTVVNGFGDAIFEANFSASGAGTVTATVPEPASLSLLAFGLVGLAAAGRRRKPRNA